MSIALSIIILSTVIALGKILGKCKIFGISLGVTWILFVGILFSHFGYVLDGELLHFTKELGLILFVYSIGMQVGPSFFSNFRAGGVKLNLLACLYIILGVLTTWSLIKITGIGAPTMVGVMSGAVTNTPGLGAAQQAFSDATGGDPSGIALGYAVAYPLGVVGWILTFIALKPIFSKPLNGFTPAQQSETQTENSVATTAIEGKGKLIQKKIIISKSKINGMTLGKLNFEKYLGAHVLKIRRAGIELNATPDTVLQLGDMLTVVGTEEAIAGLNKILGNSLKKLDEPNLISIFAGIALGCLLGSIPFHIPGIPQPIKLGLAGGPLIVSILISHFGPRLHLVTYTTTSANLMIREIGISLFLACVGLQAGTGFVDTIVNKGGLIWILYGAIITIVPLLICALIGRFAMKVPLTTLMGVLAGGSTNPPALAFSNDTEKTMLKEDNQETKADAAAVGYATVYPLSMFLRVIAAQLMILFLA